MAQGLLVTYPLLNRDLLLAGILLHDIGKIKEYSFQLRPEHTDEGRLVGHTILGILMLEEKVKEINDFPQELLMQLRHIITSHHGEKIYGTPVVPMTAEALTIHYLDNIDARLAEYYETVEKMPPDTNWTEWLNSLERRFYRWSATIFGSKPRVVPPKRDPDQSGDTRSLLADYKSKS
jgi:3'-5' exoribonuclease